MDLKVYYQKVRTLEAEIQDEFPIVVSKETGDGGAGGKYTEVTRAIAAKMITEGSARLASAEEAAGYREKQAEGKRLAEQAAEASKVQLTVVTASEMAKLTGKKEKV